MQACSLLFDFRYVEPTVFKAVLKTPLLKTPFMRKTMSLIIHLTIEVKCSAQRHELCTTIYPLYSNISNFLYPCLLISSETKDNLCGKVDRL